VKLSPASCALRGAVLVLLSAVAGLHFSARISLITADLGRHIRNGELFWQHRSILSTNFYAYTFPDFHAVCHHWGTGVVFYLVHLWGGFTGLSLFYTGMLGVTLALSFWLAVRMAGFWPAVLTTVLALPLAGSRLEIRPEGMTTLFLMLEFFILDAYRTRRLTRTGLIFLPFIQLAWINTHILFFTGFALMAFFILDLWVNDADRARWKTLASAAGAAALLSLANPFGCEGFLEPFNIFHEYGYMLAENQNILFMLKRFPDHPAYGYFVIVSVVTAALFMVRLWRERSWKAVLREALILVFFMLMAFKAVRAIGMFGFVVIPLGAFQLTEVIRLYGGAWTGRLERALSVVAAGAVALAAVSPYFFLSPLHRPDLRRAVAGQPYASSLFTVLAHPAVWGGLSADVNASADFFKASGMRGPIFNNYDIGGYLIYHLFPGERPFVDNRPEAYPAAFFREVYGPMQRDETAWDQVDGKYHFQAIYFYRHDQTEWAQPFLIRRVDDPQWAPVFADGYTIIFARRGGVNQRVIDRFELPRTMFRVVK